MLQDIARNVIGLPERMAVHFDVHIWTRWGANYYKGQIQKNMSFSLFAST